MSYPYTPEDFKRMRRQNNWFLAGFILLFIVGIVGGFLLLEWSS